MWGIFGGPDRRIRFRHGLGYIFGGGVVEVRFSEEIATSSFFADGHIVQIRFAEPYQVGYVSAEITFSDVNVSSGGHNGSVVGRNFHKGDENVTLTGAHTPGVALARRCHQLPGVIKKQAAMVRIPIFADDAFQRE